MKKYITLLLLVVFILVNGGGVALGKDNNWAKSAIESLTKSDELNSFSGVFSFPEKPITQREFLDMLKKIVPGKYSQEVFSEGYISRDEVARLLASALGYAKTSEAGYFKDQSEIQQGQAVKLNKELGLLVGYQDGTFKPKSFLTRAEAAAVLSRLQRLRPLDKGFRITKITGKAYDGNNNLLHEGRIIYPGERIDTKGGGQVLFTADDTTTIRIGPSSNVELKEKIDNLTKNESHTSIVVWAGKIFGRVQKLLNENSTFDVSSPTAVAGIRGTTFAVNVSDDGNTKVAVYTGMVAVGKRGQLQDDHILVNSKEEINLTPDDEGPAIPQTLDLSGLDSWEKSALEEALTEESQVVNAEIQRDLSEAQVKRLEKMLQKINDTIERQQEKSEDNRKDNKGSLSDNDKGANNSNNGKSNSNNGNSNPSNENSNSNNGNSNSNNGKGNNSNNGKGNNSNNGKGNNSSNNGKPK